MLTFALIVIVAAAITGVVAYKVAYNKGFKDGMARKNMMDVVSWREAIDCMNDD